MELFWNEVELFLEIKVFKVCLWFLMHRPIQYRRNEKTRIGKKCQGPTCMRMFDLEILIGKGATIDRVSSPPVPMSYISTLYHESRYYSMKWYSLIVEFFSTGTLALFPCICNTSWYCNMILWSPQGSCIPYLLPLLRMWYKNFRGQA